ncbi:MAG: DNA polymerase III subunit delta [Geobacteraceae bacterium]|nr:DNA polymerase III subunit delta [Geobacteraceae bacterium]
MKNQDMLDEIERGAVRPIYYLFGDEPYLMEKCVRRLQERLLTPDLRDFNLTIFYGSESRGEEIAEAAATLPMFASWRVVLVKNADALSASSLETLTGYLRNPSPSTCLVFQGSTIDQRKKFFIEMKKRGGLVEFKRLYDNQLPAFIRGEASALGKKVEGAAAEMLAYLVGNNLQELVSELEKGVLYAGNRDVITVDDIRAVVSHTRVNTVFELTDALGEKKLDRALRNLDTLLRGGEAPLLVLAMMARHYRQVWKVRELREKKMPAQEIGKAAGIPPYFLQGIIRQSDNYSVPELRRVFRKMSDADTILKTGRGKPGVYLESLVLDICVGTDSKPGLRAGQ